MSSTMGSDGKVIAIVQVGGSTVNLMLRPLSVPPTADGSRDSSSSKHSAAALRAPKRLTLTSVSVLMVSVA